MSRCCSSDVVLFELPVVLLVALQTALGSAHVLDVRHVAFSSTAKRQRKTSLSLSLLLSLLLFWFQRLLVVPCSAKLKLTLWLISSLLLTVSRVPYSVQAQALCYHHY